MLRDYANQVVRDKEGGELFTTFFCIAIACIVIASFVGGRLLSGRDTLIRFVPADAVVYVHANGTEAVRLLEASTSLHARPSEAATFAVERDGALVWTKLIAWDFPRAISSEEFSSLAGVDATTLARNTFAIGPDTITSASNGPTLQDDPRIVRSLAAVGSASSLQAYAIPSTFLRDTFGTDAETLLPVVLGMNRRGHGYSAVILKLDVAERFAALGMRMPPSSSQATTSAFSPRSDLALFGPGDELSPFDLLFPKDGYPNAYPQGIAEAGAALRELFGRTSVGISFLPEPESKTGTGMIMHLPGIPPERVVDAIERFAISAWPARRSITLPDAVRSFELLIDPEHSRFKPTQDGFKLLAIIDGPHIAVGPDGAHGTLILDDASLIPSAKALKPVSSSDCPIRDQQAFVDMADSASFFLSLPFGDRILSYVGGKSLIINKDGDSLVIFCGYTVDNVDK